jgi:hypothetical protein
MANYSSLEERLLSGHSSRQTSRHTSQSSTVPYGYEYDGASEQIEAHPSPGEFSDEPPTPKPDGATSVQAFMNTYRAIVGTGILALPSAIKGCGLGYGVIFLILTSALSLFTMKLLIRWVTNRPSNSASYA